jgi:hypothetical protein
VGLDFLVIVAGKLSVGAKRALHHFEVAAAAPNREYGEKSCRDNKGPKDGGKQRSSLPQEIRASGQFFSSIFFIGVQ